MQVSATLSFYFAAAFNSFCFTWGITVGDTQPVTLTTVDSQQDSAPQHERHDSTDLISAADAADTAAAPLSIATAMASVAMTVGFIYRSAGAPTTDLQYCNIPDDGSYTAQLSARIASTSARCGLLLQMP